MDFVDQSCRDFISVLASKSPVPGGGGASALVGAVGVALGSMVGSLTLGKKKYAPVEKDILALKQKAGKLQDELLALVQADAEAFEPLSRAYGLPRETEAEQAEKARVMEAALKTACLVPFEIMEKCGEAIRLHREFAEKGAMIAISDVGCGVVCLKAALMAASLNVFINTKAMADRQYAEEMNGKTKDMLAEYEAMADEIYAQAAARFSAV